MSPVRRHAPSRGRVRVLRAAVLGSASLTLAAAAHVIGGGDLPSAGVLGVAAFLVGLSAVTFTARRCGMRVLLLILSAQQLLLHWLLGAAAAATGGCGAMMSGLPHHAIQGGRCTPMTAAMGGSSAPAWGMLLIHGLAVLATARLLSRGEAWLWRTVDAFLEVVSAAPGGRPCSDRSRVMSSVQVVLPALTVSPAAPRGPPPRSK
jgi:hypothetical protein